MISQSIPPEITSAVGDVILAALKTIYRWKWGYPFPYIVLTREKLIIIALKQKQAKVYEEFTLGAVNYIRPQGGGIYVNTSEKQLNIECDVNKVSKKEISTFVKVFEEQSANS